MLPLWMQWAQGIAVITIPFAVAWIAYKQMRIAAAKLNLDLYEKRFKVFDAARQFLVDVVQSAHVDAGRVVAFNVVTADAVFLFEKEVEEYLDSLRDRILRLKRLKAQETAADEYGEEEKRQKLGDLAADQHIELSKELPILIDAFRPYLKLGNI
jgi:hypothetical protein